MGARHSPGPWTIVMSNVDAEDGPMYDLHIHETCEDDPPLAIIPATAFHQDANAALIADAPAMLALLRKHEAPDPERDGTCLECRRSLGHATGCAWGALLDKHGRE